MSSAPLHLDAPGRSLILVAGIPGAGKSTLLGTLASDATVVVLDSDQQRSALRGLLPGLPYALYRPLVHLLHRCAVVRAAASDVPTVVVHLPATDARTRATVVRLAELTGRTAHLLWLDVAPELARRGQAERGRTVPTASFARHAHRAASVPEHLLGEHPSFATVTVTDRVGAAGGLKLATGAVHAS